MLSSDPTLDIHAFVVTRWLGQPVNAAPDEHDDLQWFEPAELTGLTLADPASLPSILSAVHAEDACTSSSSTQHD